MPTIRGDVNNPAVAFRGARVDIELWGEDRPVVGFVDGAQIVLAHSLATGVDGSWSVSIPHANSAITPSGTVYRIIYTVSGRSAAPFYVLVPSGGGPYDVEDILATPPATLALSPFDAPFTFQDHGAAGAAETLDANVAETHRLTLDANCTLTFTAVAAPKRSKLTVLLTQDATGGRTVTWPASVDWPGGQIPVLSTAAGAIDLFTFLSVDGGVQWFGVPGGQAFS